MSCESATAPMRKKEVASSLGKMFMFLIIFAKSNDWRPPSFCVTAHDIDPFNPSRPSSEAPYGFGGGRMGLWLETDANW